MRSSTTKEPRFAQWVLSLISKYDEEFIFSGDLSEEFKEMSDERGRFIAHLWYWTQVLYAIPFYCKHQVEWRFIMFKNYLKIALRNLWKFKGYSFINIAGLAVGMACSLLIFLWMQDELSYEDVHMNAAHLCRAFMIEKTDKVSQLAVTPPPLAEALNNMFPEIINSMRFDEVGRVLIRYKNNAFYESQGYLADATIFEMFSFPFISGDPKKALDNLHSIVITEKMAKKYFELEDPIGKTVQINNQWNFIITGVIKDTPKKSHMQFDFLLPFNFLSNWGYDLDNWGNSSFYTYIQLQPGSSVDAVNEKIADARNRRQVNLGFYPLKLQPIKDIHLKSSMKFDFAVNGSIMYIYIFSALAFFVLFIACINYMNLSTARYTLRAREVAMRKVVGAARINIIKQFFLESIFFTLIACLFAIGLVLLFMPSFNSLTDKQMVVDFTRSPHVYLGFIGIVLLTGGVSGIYPSLFLSSFQPVRVFKKALFSVSSRRFSMRRILVIVQFALSIILIIGTSVVYQQLDYIKKRRLGFDKENVLYLNTTSGLKSQYEAIKSELLSNQNILHVTRLDGPPISEANETNSQIFWEGKHPDDRLTLKICWVDFDFIETFGMDMAEGRSFSNAFSTDAENGMILNEAAVQATHMKAPIGKRFQFYGGDGTIIGVVKNFHHSSLHRMIEPVVLKISPGRTNYLGIRIVSEQSDIAGTLTFLKRTIKKFEPNAPFEYEFLDRRLNNLYRADERTGKIFGYFTFLALFVSCLGLCGLNSFLVERHTKEIGIRKVLGASVTGIFILISRGFTKWIILANLIAWPIAYYFMNKWLQNFAYRTSLSIWTFILSGLAALFIALLTVSYQTIKAATANPVDSLRYE